MDGSTGQGVIPPIEMVVDSEETEKTPVIRGTVTVERPIYSQVEFDAGYSRKEKPPTSIKDVLKRKFLKWRCSAECCKSFLYRMFPFVHIMRKYSLRRDLPNDVIAGLTIGIMQIPQGMAYAMLAELAPIYGLYISFFPIIVYFFTGTSRHISLGAIAVTSLMVGAVVAKYGQMCCPADGGAMTSRQAAFCSEYTNGAPSPGVSSNTTSDSLLGYTLLTTTSWVNDSTRTEGPSGAGVDDFELCKAKIAAALTLMTGLLQLAMGFLNMGFITTYLSEPLTRAFITGSACHVFTSQVKSILGLKVRRFTGIFKIIKTYIDIFGKIASTNVASVIIAFLSMIVLYLTKEYVNPRVKRRFKIPVPIELIVVIIATIASHFGYFNERFDVRVIGHIPRGIPSPQVPPPDLYGMVIGDCIAIAIVAYAFSMSMVQLMAKKRNYQVDSNQELMAYGLTTTITSFLHCYPTAASISRSILQEGTGGVTQVAGLVSCTLILFVLLVLGPLFEQLPTAVLAAVIIVALKNTFKQVLDLKKLWYVNKYDFAIWLVVFLSTVVLDVDIGLGIGVAFALMTVVYRTQRPSTSTLGQVPRTNLYKNVEVYDAAQEIQGIFIFRFEAPLYYANGEHFVNTLFRKSGVDPRILKRENMKMKKKIEKERKENENRRRNMKTEENSYLEDEENIEMSLRTQLPQPSVHHIIVNCGAMGFIDSVGVSTLSQVIQEYEEVGVTVFLANCKVRIRDMLEVAGFFEKIEKDRLFVATHDAVLVALKEASSATEQETREMANIKQATSIVNSENYTNDKGESQVLLPADVNSH